MLTGSTKDNVIIYLLFWAMYAPLALFRWHSGGGTLLEISIILLLGLGIVLAGLFAKEYLIDRRRRSYHVLYEVEDEPEEAPEYVTCFDNVFKPNFGKVEIDLD